MSDSIEYADENADENSIPRSPQEVARFKPKVQPDSTADAALSVPEALIIDVDASAPRDKMSNLHSLLSAPCGDEVQYMSKVTMLLCAILGYGILYTLMEHEVKPGGQLFALIMLVVLSQGCGYLVSLMRLPPLLGMLLCGIALRNLNFFAMSGIYAEIVVCIREIALSVILLKAGLGLDPSALLKLSFVVARLAIVPCIAEAVAAAFAAHILLGLPWLWGLLLGAVLSAVSPAVVVPTLLSLKERGFGEDKGISTLVIAASSIDDIVSISCFGVILGMIFSTGNLTQNLIHGPIEIMVGTTAGFVLGFVAGCIPHRNEKILVAKRSFVVGASGLVAVLGSQMIGYSGSGPLAAIILSFVASLCWKWQGWTNSYNPVAHVFSHVWMVMQPLLFGLIGTEICLADLKWSLIGQALGVLAFGLLIRIISCCIVLFGANLNRKEIIFVNLAWLPKATVQAALGPVALDLCKKNGLDRHNILDATNILTIAVLSILVTAPIGAIGISLGGPRLLTRNEALDTTKNSKPKPPPKGVAEDEV